MRPTSLGLRSPVVGRERGSRRGKTLMTEARGMEGRETAALMALRLLLVCISLCLHLCVGLFIFICTYDEVLSGLEFRA